MKSPPKGRNRCAKRDSTCTHRRQQILHQLFELIEETSPLTLPADSQRLLCSRLSRFVISHSVETLHLFMDIVLQSVQKYKRATTTFATNLLNLVIITELPRFEHSESPFVLLCLASSRLLYIPPTNTGEGHSDRQLSTQCCLHSDFCSPTFNSSSLHRRHINRAYRCICAKIPHSFAPILSSPQSFTTTPPLLVLTTLFLHCTHRTGLTLGPHLQASDVRIHEQLLLYLRLCSIAFGTRAITIQDAGHESRQSFCKI